MKLKNLLLTTLVAAGAFAGAPAARGAFTGRAIATEPASTRVAAAASAIEPAPTPATVWQHHIDAWVARDLDAIVGDYDERSILIVNNVVYRGRTEIRRVFERLFSIFDGGSNRIDPAVLEGRIVYITWHFTPTEMGEHHGTDTFVIEGGVIRVQTIASTLYQVFRLD